MPPQPDQSPDPRTSHHPDWRDRYPKPWPEHLLTDDARRALRFLVHCRKTFAGGLARMDKLEAALGPTASRVNVWQAIHRLRDAGYRIDTHRCPRGDRRRGGYTLRHTTPGEDHARARDPPPTGFTVL